MRSLLDYAHIALELSIKAIRKQAIQILGLQIVLSNTYITLSKEIIIVKVPVLFSQITIVLFCRLRLY